MDMEIATQSAARPAYSSGSVESRVSSGPAFATAAAIRTATGQELAPLPMGKRRAGSTSATSARKRTSTAADQPHWWEKPPLRVVRKAEMARIMEEDNRRMHEWVDRLEQEGDEGCETEEDKAAFREWQARTVVAFRRMANMKPEDIVMKPMEFNDTKEEHLTAEQMEKRVDPQFQAHHQAKHFATLALAHYNQRKKHKFDLATVLLSNCFFEACRETYAHVNFTAIPQKNQNDADAAAPMKKLFFAELLLVPDLHAGNDAEPMRVLDVRTIDDAPCFGGCHEMFRKIDHKMRKMDYERCHACSDRIKHPTGHLFVGGHNSTRMPYVSAT